MNFAVECMGKESLSILVYEKEYYYLNLLRELCADSFQESISFFGANNYLDISAIIRSNSVDALIYELGYMQNDFDFTMLKKTIHDLPILIIALPEQETQAIELIRSGAQDYIIKDHFDAKSFVRIVRSAIERQNLMIKLEQRTLEFQANEARLLNVIINNADGIIVVDENKKVRFVNPAAEKIFHKTASTFLEQEFEFPFDTERSGEVTLSKSDGADRVVELRAVSTQWEGNRAYLISVRDITERKSAETRLKENEERYALAIKGSQDGVWDWDLVAGEVYFSPEWKNILGYKEDEISADPDEWFNRVHPDDLSQLRSQIEAHLEGNIATIENEHRLCHRNGTFRWVVVRGTAVLGDDKKPTRLAGSLRDITDRKEAEEGLKTALEELKFALASEKVLLEELDKKNKDLVELSITDGLTGLFNHRFIQERFDFEFKRAKRYHVPLSCMMLDIDHFKKVNDTYGHQFGDLVLREISTIIRQNTREVDICGRYGGEEFLIITTQNVEGAMMHASKLHKAVENHVFQNERHSVHITVSIGISEYKSEITSKQEMIERSDLALYQAKRDGRNLIRVWKEEQKHDMSTLDLDSISSLKTEMLSLSNQMRATYMESTNALLKAVDVKDHYTLEHSENVSRYSVAIAREMNIDDEEIEIIKNAGLLHDIGKIGIDKAILVKKDPLTKGEFEILKKHPMIGVNIIKDVKFLEKEIPIIKHHHEWYDGSGYPQGLKGREIPLGAQIMAVADAYDAMTTDREFKQKLSKDAAIKELQCGSGIQFSPEVVDVFLKLLLSHAIE